MTLMVIDQLLFRKRQLSLEVVASVSRELTIMARRKDAPRIAILEVLRMLANVTQPLFRDTVEF